MKRTLIKNCNIINEGEIFESDILIEDSIITKISNSISPNYPNTKIIDAEGNYIIPGLIDDQVHFREPGLTHKGNIFSEILDIFSVLLICPRDLQIIYHTQEKLRIKKYYHPKI